MTVAIEPWVCGVCGGDGEMPHTDNDVSGGLPCPRCLGFGGIEKAASEVEHWNSAYYELLASREQVKRRPPVAPIYHQLWLRSIDRRRWRRHS